MQNNGEMTFGTRWALFSLGPHIIDGSNQFACTNYPKKTLLLPLSELSACPPAGYLNCAVCALPPYLVGNVLLPFKYSLGWYSSTVYFSPELLLSLAPSCLTRVVSLPKWLGNGFDVLHTLKSLGNEYDKRYFCSTAFCLWLDTSNTCQWL